MTPKTNGRKPTDFRTFIDRPEPIKYSVIVIPTLDRETIDDVNLLGKLKIVLATIANMKKRMNQGIFTFASFCLKKKVVATDNGIIHSARVNFTMVATSSALCP